MAEEIIDRFHQFALMEEEKETVSIESSDVLSSIKYCEVQVWNIPLHWMSMDVGHKIKNALGGVVGIVIPENGSKEGQYMRLKVRINITKPLPRGHNDKTCTQRAKDVQGGTVKIDQFGIWLKAENHVLFSEKRRHQGTSNINGNPMFKGRRAEGITSSLQHLEKDTELTHTQGQNESEGKKIVGSSREDDGRSNRKDLNQMKPMEVTNYGSHEKESIGIRDYTSEEN